MTDGRGRVAPALAELIIPCAAIAFTSYYIWSVREGPLEAKFSAYLIGTALIVVSTLFLVTRLWAWLHHRIRTQSASERDASRAVVVKRLALLALTLGYVLMIQYGGGFTIANFVFLSCAIVLLSGGAWLWRAVRVAAILAFSGYLLFVVAFDTRFPEGPFERAVERLFE